MQGREDGVAVAHGGRRGRRAATVRRRRHRSQRRKCCEPGTTRGRRGAVALGRCQLRRILRRAIATQTASVLFSHRRCVRSEP
ncbi:hypothetical protein AHAS_Ahas13G0385300 [Arachis hypogaea]